MTPRCFAFGPLGPKLSEQLSEDGIPKKELALLDRLADAVVLLSIQDMLSEAEAERARQRLVKRISKLLREHAP
jgi:hypothetical protein